VRQIAEPRSARRRDSEGVVIVGLMSGTSVDGVSAAVARFAMDGEDAPVPDLLAHVARPYSPAQRSRLLRAMEGAPPAEYCRLNFELGEWLAEAALAALRQAGMEPSEAAAIASHGQTVWHEPGHSTWQLGESAVIAERTGIDVISDFRVRDIAAGGQGAPLVPIADALLFAAPDRWRALQNLGGIGNVSVVPPRRACEPVRAFDTGPGCAVIDGVTRALVPSLPYDVDGSLARRGRPIEAVVNAALTDPYFAAPPPKSTGRELLSPA
jgi:anhydro-N-acetylmuramic acid kinase